MGFWQDKPANFDFRGGGYFFIKIVDQDPQNMISVHCCRFDGCMRYLTSITTEMHS